LNISTRGRYGVRALIEIALNEEREPVTINSIARHQKLPVSYLEQILNKLRRSGIIKSVRGSKGGYLLGRPKREINIRQVIEVLDGPFAVADCSKAGCPPETCIGTENCIASILWKNLEDNLDRFLESVTLEDLLRDARRLSVPMRTEVL
jgi:Rrf2 family cysteine metabolism transcriptional repressor